MSRSIKGSKGPGYDYWKRRAGYSASCSYGQDVKKLTNRRQRTLMRKHLAAGNEDAMAVVAYQWRGMTPT